MKNVQSSLTNNYPVRIVCLNSFLGKFHLNLVIITNVIFTFFFVIWSPCDVSSGINIFTNLVFVSWSHYVIFHVLHLLVPYYGAEGGGGNLLRSE